MKSTIWSALALASAISFPLNNLLADDQPDSPGGAAPKARKSATGVRAASTSEAPLAAIPVSPGPAIARERNVNVRGQAAINSEVITRLNRGDKVTVIEEVTVKKPKADEPAKWVKIALPPTVPVWVHAAFIDPATKTVKPNKLKLRGGPGENYSVLGIIEKGTAVKEIEPRGDWLKIEPPDGAYAYVAAHLLAPDTTGTAVIASAPPAPATATPGTGAPTLETPQTVISTGPTAIPAPAPTPQEPAITAPPQNVEPQVSVASPQNLVLNFPAPTQDPSTPAGTPAIPATPAEPAPTETPQVEEELVKRVVTREGIVKRSVSIQAPSYFALQSIDTGKTINYLYSESTNVVLKDFNGQRVVLSGEERLDERWPNTPVIYIETLQPVP